MTMDLDARWRRRSRIILAAVTVLGAGAVAVSCKGAKEKGKAAQVAKAEPVALQVGGLPVT